MKRHLLSFLRSPIGYVVNFLATVLCHGPTWLDVALERPVVWACETFCASDGVQNDMLF